MTEEELTKIEAQAGCLQNRDAIALAAEVRRLRNALKPIADGGVWVTDYHGGGYCRCGQLACEALGIEYDP